ncbi:ParB/RepB/Spo0J family partition protein [Bifidobacterium catenulatum]|uniref:ParB/RepB/Spo0J family partition protein n=1 Tax=Bifidobacterium catenulatum TaxID=1686 RepID=UPI001F03AC35|nr:ParB/RepB/Spo0J family partition protein [Bifidobacterium catenulatum]
MGITIEDLPVEDLHPNPNNPRRQVGDVADLEASIRSQGIKQPLLVTPTGETDIDGHAQYRVVIGHRRLAAAKQAGLESVPAIIERMDARREREVMLVENSQRSDLTPIEEADGYQGLLDLGVGVKEMAEKTGRSDRFVRRRLRIARIPQETRDMSADFSQLSLDQLDKLAEFESDPDMQRELARSTDFEWTYRRLVSERDKTKWCGEADKALAKAGVRVESFPDGKNYWTFEPRGYRRRTVISSTRDPFWKQFTGEDGCRNSASSRTTATTACTSRFHSTSSNGLRARKPNVRPSWHGGEELDRKARDFEAIARDTRFAWIRTNLHTLTREQTVAGICELALAETVGWHSMFVGQRLHGEGVVEALIGFGWNLPITEHDGDHWSLECKENLDQIRMVLRDRPLRILDVLAARQEDNADWRAWRTMRGVDEMCVWYGALEHLGYQPSAEEREALKGAMVEKEQKS